MSGSGYNVGPMLTNGKLDPQKYEAMQRQQTMRELQASNPGLFEVLSGMQQQLATGAGAGAQTPVPQGYNYIPQQAPVMNPNNLPAPVFRYAK